VPWRADGPRPQRLKWGVRAGVVRGPEAQCDALRPGTGRGPERGRSPTAAGGDGGLRAGVIREVKDGVTRCDRGPVAARGAVGLRPQRAGRELRAEVLRGLKHSATCCDRGPVAARSAVGPRPQRVRWELRAGVFRGLKDGATCCDRGPVAARSALCLSTLASRSIDQGHEEATPPETNRSSA